MSASPWFAHPTAVVDEPADIGEGTRIWHFSHVMAGAVLGPGCNLGQNVFVAATARLGARCKVQNNVSIYDGVECEDEVFLVDIPVAGSAGLVDYLGRVLPPRLARRVDVSEDTGMITVAGPVSPPWAMLRTGLPAV